MPEQRKTAFLRWLARPEAMIGLSAVVVSVIAVLISAYEARIQREWQRAAAWPFVQLSRSFYYEPGETDASGRRNWILTFNAENVGVGPAQIKDFRVTVDGEPHQTWKSAIQALLKKDVEVEYGQSTINGAILPAERMYRMFEYRDPAHVEEIAAAMTERLDFEACYCSVFNDCWKTSYRSFDGSQKVKNCERGDASFQE